MIDLTEALRISPGGSTLLTPPLQRLVVSPACPQACRLCAARCGEGWIAPEVVEFSLTVAAQVQQPVLFVGGDPLTHPDLDRLVRFACSHQLHIELATPGSLVTYPRAQQLRSAGLTRLRFTAVGGPAAHDVERGDGSFAVLARAVADAHRAGLPVDLQFSANGSSLANLVDFYSAGHALGVERLLVSTFDCRYASNGMAQRDAEAVVTTVLRLVTERPGGPDLILEGPELHIRLLLDVLGETQGNRRRLQMEGRFTPRRLRLNAGADNETSADLCAPPPQ